MSEITTDRPLRLFHCETRNLIRLLRENRQRFRPEQAESMLTALAVLSNQIEDRLPQMVCPVRIVNINPAKLRRFLNGLGTST